MGDTKYGKITTEKKVIPEDEPLFLLRGQDSLASLTVEYYGLLLEERGLYTMAKNVRQAAERMRQWPRRKLPD